MAAPTTSQQEESSVQRFDWKRLFDYSWVEKNIPFFLFLAFLAVVYIYNGHMADKIARNITITEKNISELQYEYKSVKSEVIYRSKASELVKAVEPLGLKELSKPPVVLSQAPAGKTP
jgi:cell division protein FtsL